MTDFILNNYDLLIKATICLSCLAGVFVYKNHKEYTSRIFIYFVLFVLVIEIVGGYTIYIDKYELFSPLKQLIKNSPFRRNYWWYIIAWDLGSVLFVSFYIFKILKLEKYKKLVKYSSLSYLLIALGIISINTDDLFSGFIPSVFLLGFLVMLTNVMLYFIECLQDDRVLEFRQSFNSIVLGTLLVWWLIVAPLSFYEDYYHPNDEGYIQLRSLILFFSNFFMYGMFTFAFLFCKPQNH